MPARLYRRGHPESPGVYQVPRISEKSQTIKARTMKIFTVRAFDMLQDRVTALPRQGTAQRARQAMPQRTGSRP